MNDDRRRALVRRRVLRAGLATLSTLSLLSALPAAAQPADPPTQQPRSARSLTASEARTAAYLESIRQDPARLHGFFRHLPKGGDLHNHLSGAVPTEFLITLAAKDGLCIDRKTMTAVPPPCGPGKRPAADARTDRAFHDALVRAWSMQDFPPGESGHDHFFDTFGKFGEVTWRHRGALLSKVADGMAEQNQFYLETLVTPASEEAKKLADQVGWDGDLARMHKALVADGKLDRLVATARKEADEADTEFRRVSRCGTSRPAPGCRLTVRWNSQVSRGSSPERVFTQMELGMRLAERDPRFTAVNLVQPEDGDSALRNYTLQMRMLAYLHRTYPRAHITLHAGELWPGLAKPEDLKFHINQAVDVAHAERIGHGVDLVHEDNWRQLARTMADREVAVEVPFTSNAQILGVKGAEHPFTVYRAYGVPIVLATDDPGISRIDITHEYRYASRTYHLGYGELKDLARASLEYAFLPGRSLWRGNPTRDGYRPVAACRGQLPGSGSPGAACRHLLASSPKAAVQWRQETASASFERNFALPR
ncbi:adenosine deaminase family protein [Streptomyces natalensis]|uniref:adenosine deaminase n=1 Tax=Streptomyces natalensis ATCC 27448 TaxID=1240678 RepID=A0A0D7CP16_9ACTN|nr:adenosine deaminase [Streptomyces natalensis]KIZ17610.1 adenosine deaminase [Streptomyces natalensis ATCC 27448]